MENIRKASGDDVDPIVLVELLEEHDADIVAQLNDEDLETAASILAQLPLDRVVEIFDRPELSRASDLILELPEDFAGRVLTGMSADRAADLLRQLDGQDRTKLLALVDFETAQSLKLLLAYHEGTAGSIMTTEFVSVPSTFTVADTLKLIREVEHTRETVYAIYVTDPVTRELVRTVTLRQLITGAPDQPILDIAPDRDPISVDPDTDREEVARLISIHDLLAVPVLNARYRVLGIVTVDDVIDAILAESTEDVQKFGGCRRHGRALSRNRLPRNDPQTRRLALRTFPR